MAPSSTEQSLYETQGGSVLGLVAFVLVVLVVGVLLFAGGEHGPRRHAEVGEQFEPEVADRDRVAVSAPSGREHALAPRGPAALGGGSVLSDG